MQGKTVVITGGTSGIGKETARQLLDMGAKVTLAIRNELKGRATIDELQPFGEVDYAILDLASLASVRKFAEEYKGKHDSLDVLINNAGVVPTSKQLTEDGFEMQIGVNHLAHFLLTRELLPLLRKQKGRVVTVASTMHMAGRIDYDSFRGEKWYNGNIAYMQSKLANILFTRELARREADITAFSLHPGAVNTDIFRDQPEFVQRFIKTFTISPEEGAATSVYLASESGLDRYNGEYFVKCKPAFSMFQARDDENARKLWEVSERLVGL